MLPRDLPKLRDQTLRHLDDKTSSLRTNLSEDMQPGLDALALHLSQASLYWVKADMAALAVAAGSQLDATDWGVDARPSDAGLILFQDGIGELDSMGVPIPVDAIAWGRLGSACLAWLLVLRRTIVERTKNAPFILDQDSIPPLVPVLSYAMRTGSPEAPKELGEGRTVLTTLSAAWSLMQQPTLVDRQAERAEKSMRRAYARAGRVDPEITVVDLRRAYVPDDRDPDVGLATGQHYRHRFVVSGHWRNQAHGPERSLRRRQWIPSYMKGPDGAPLLVTEKVNVWRR